MVINEDGDNSFIKGFLDYMNQYVIFVEPAENEQAIKDSLIIEKHPIFLQFLKALQKAFTKMGKYRLIKLAAAASMEAITVDDAINNYFNMAKIYQSYVPEINTDQLNAYVKANLQEQTQVSLQEEVTDSVVAGNNKNKYFYNCLGYIIIAVFITSVSTIMFSFHGLDIRRRHSASPLSSRNMNMQLIFANLIFVLTYLLLFIVVGYILNSNRIVNTNTLLYWLNIITYGIVTLSISYLIGISVNSKKAIAALSTALSLGLAFLSGMFVPQEYLGAPVLRVASFTTAYWFVKANNTIETITSNSWSDISAIASYMAIQLGFAVAIISIALVVSKRKRQQAN